MSKLSVVLLICCCFCHVSYLLSDMVFLSLLFPRPRIYRERAREKEKLLQFFSPGGHGRREGGRVLAQAGMQGEREKEEEVVEEESLFKAKTVRRRLKTGAGESEEGRDCFERRVLSCALLYLSSFIQFSGSARARARAHTHTHTHTQVRMNWRSIKTFGISLMDRQDGPFRLELQSVTLERLDHVDGTDAL